MGFKLFQQDEVLTVDDLEDFLMHQMVQVFETESERDIALVGTLEAGFTAYINATSSLYIYDGSSWRRIATYDELANIPADTEIRRVILMTVDDPIELYIPNYFLFDGCADEWAVWGFW